MAWDNLENCPTAKPDIYQRARALGFFPGAGKFYSQDVEMTAPEMPIFTRTFDFLTWLLPATNHFPRAHRHSFTQRLLDAAFDLREYLEQANYRQGKARLERLDRADEALGRVRT
jgi:hypothetical protein